jgi:DNA-binding transcriptional ArsR family regulator
MLFKALANEARLKILFSLMNGKRCVSELCKSTGLEQSRVSHNLRCLVNCGFVLAERRGKYRIYSLNEPVIKQILLLADVHARRYRRRLLKCEVLKR